MGNTWHSAGLQDAFDRRIAEDPAWMPVLIDARKKIRDGFFDREYVSQWFQQSYGSTQLEDVYSFLQYHAWIQSGEMARCAIEVGEMPFPDGALERNARALSDLPKPFKVRLWCGLNDADGILIWTAPISCEVLGTEGGELVRERVEIQPGFAPLEVGDTKASRSLNHYMLENALARWPYGEKVITLMVRKNPRPAISDVGISIDHNRTPATLWD